MGLLGYNLQSFWEKGVQPPKCGSSHESLCPYQAFEASDGPIMIGVANDNLWRKFCVVVGLEDIIDDARFRTNAERVRHREETLGHVRAALARGSVAHWQEVLSQVGVPCSPINSLSQLVAHPHTAASGIVLDYVHPTAGPLKGIGQPISFDGEPRRTELPPPNLGQHTDEILAELGLSAEDIAHLRETRSVS
jgi:crotonobetainyl-CoA:carnitine CoA-transferase CaiB-like acyl-CoA transferase